MTTTILWNADFETGDLSQEASLEVAYGGWVEISNAHSYSHPYSARAYAADFDYAKYSNYPRARINPLWAPFVLDEIYIKAHFYIVRLDGYIQVLRAMASGSLAGETTYVASMVLRSSQVELQMGSSKGTIWQPIGTWNGVAPFNFQLNRWYSFQLGFKKATAENGGGGRIWIDGELIVDALNLNTSLSPQIDRALVGGVLCNNWFDLYVDDFIVATEPIVPITRNLSVTSNISVPFTLQRN